MDIKLKNGTIAYNVKSGDLAELERLGLVDETTKTVSGEDVQELNTCVLCGKKYSGFGNSTWGYWELHGASKQDDATKGEKMRCCDNCNKYYIVPARLKLAGYAVQAVQKTK